MAKKDFPVEDRLVATGAGAGGGRRGQDARRGQGRHTHDRVRNRGQWGFAVCPGELGLGLGDRRGGGLSWERRGTSRKAGTCAPYG